MSRTPEYQIYWVDLSAAGTHEIVGEYNVFRMVFAGTRDAATGRPASLRLDALVEVAFGTRVDDYAPMGVNCVATGAAGRYQLRWLAQPGVWAAFLVSNTDMGLGLDVQAPPARQIVTQTAGVSLAATQVTVGTSAVQVAAARSTRQKLSFKNASATATVYLGADSAVTTANGFPLGPGEGFTIEGTSAAIYGIADMAGADLRVLEEF